MSINPHDSPGDGQGAVPDCPGAVDVPGPLIDPSLLAQALRISRIGCWQYDNATGLMVWSPEMFTLMGFDPVDGVPTYERMVSHVHPRDVRLHWAFLQRALRDGKPYGFDIRLDPTFTAVQWLHVTIQPALTVDGTVDYLFGVAIDISERKAAEGQTKEYAGLLEEKMAELSRANERLEALATTDGLTGITNHRAFYERLGVEHQRSQRSGAPLAIVLIDVDRFKKYNDTYGHLDGDAVLKQIARLLVDSVRATDLVARYGGEEFVVMLPTTSLDVAQAIAERCRSSIEAADWAGRPVTASFGVAVSTEGGGSVDQVVAAADRALYAAKSAGRNRVCVG